MTSPYLNTRQAAEYLHYASAKSFHAAVMRLGIPHERCGKRLLFRPEKLDEFTRMSALRPRRRRVRAA